MDDLIKQLNSLDATNREQREAIETVISLIRFNEVNPRQISIGEYQQLSLFD